MSRAEPEAGEGTEKGATPRECALSTSADRRCIPRERTLKKREGRRDIPTPLTGVSRRAHVGIVRPRNAARPRWRALSPRTGLCVKTIGRMTHCVLISSRGRAATRGTPMGEPPAHVPGLRNSGVVEDPVGCANRARRSPAAVGTIPGLAPPCIALRRPHPRLRLYQGPSRASGHARSRSRLSSHWPSTPARSLRTAT